MRGLQAELQDNPGREPGGLISAWQLWENTARAAGTALLRAWSEKEAVGTNTTTVTHALVKI